MRIFTIVVIFIFALCSCENTINSDNTINNTEEGFITIKFSPYSIEPFTRAEAKELFTKINFMAYFEDGTKAFSDMIIQYNDVSQFGTIKVNLSSNTYNILAVGHSCTRNATLSPEKVSFTASNGKKLTETFYYWGKITTTDEPEVFDCAMKRVGAMFRLVLQDDSIPSNVTKYKFEYSGASWDFNPKTGMGVSNSKQSEIREVNSDNIYEIYTFPKETTDYLTVKISALDSSENIIASRELTEVPVENNAITSYTGTLFTETSNPSNGSSFNFTIDSTWEKIYEYTF